MWALQSQNFHLLFRLGAVTFIGIINIVRRMEKIEFVGDQPTVEHPKLQKLFIFIQYHDIGYKMIWGNNESLSATDFVTIMNEKFGYACDIQQELSLKKISPNSSMLKPQNLQPYGLWKNFNRNTIFKKGSQIVKDRIRPETAKNFARSTNLSSLASKNDNSRVLKHSLTKDGDLNKNSRLKQSEEALDKKIVQNALDKKWEYLIKVGEMNSWAKGAESIDRAHKFTQCLLLQKPEPVVIKSKTYKIEDSEYNLQICQQDQNGVAQVLPLKVFDQKYQSMKKKCSPEQKSKNNMKGTMLLVLDKKQKVSKAKLSEKISQRDQQLNYLLLEIMRMKTVFEQQEQILNQCGVNS